MEIWDESKSYKELHWELIHQAMRIIKAKKGEFRPEDMEVLKKISGYLKAEKKVKYCEEIEGIINKD